MRFPLLPILVMLVLNALVDAYVYFAIYTGCRRRAYSRAYLVSSVVLALALVALCVLPKRSGSDAVLQTVMWGLYGYLSIYIAKYIYLIGDVLSRLPLLWRGHRWRWLSVGAAALAVVVLALLCWGPFNRSRVDVEQVDVTIPGLPASFDGYRIVQLSDLHVGSWGKDTAFIHRVVEETNALRPDLIVFTGDLVNRHSAELPPFMSTLSRLHAPDGVYAIMGNHDYGDYCDWPDEAAHLADADSLKQMEGRMGWRMLNNDHAWLTHGPDSIALIGVENIGDPPFTVYGDLAAAYPDPRDGHVKILLSHNPAHWDNEIENLDQNIALTLSGHTHAMQCRIAGLSPAAWRYRHWGGLYADSLGRQLYVNIGAGTVGMPARIGATPEITLITLRK